MPRSQPTRLSVWALGLMEPTDNGIGGDLFAIVGDPDTVHGFNGPRRAPAGRSLAQLRAKLVDAKEIPAYGSLPVTVPGTVDGWFELHGRFGKLPISDVLAPAIAYAREGFPLTPVIARDWANNMARFDQVAREQPGLIEELDNARATYLIDGKPPVAGPVFRNPDLADTLEQPATGGRAAFYDGPITERIDAYMQRIGRDLRYADFAAHHGEWVEPGFVDYRGHQVYELPPNGQGYAALQMLNILAKDRGQLFALIEDHPNVYAPGKRPFHTIIPAFVLKDGQPWRSFGLMGGSMQQPQGHVQVLINLIDYGMNLPEAGDAARIRHEGGREPTDIAGDPRGVVYVESGVPSASVDGLERRGHVVKVGPGGFGGYQAILRDPVTGVYAAATEMRKDGIALGY